MTVLWKTIEEYQKIGIQAIESAWKENRALLVTLLQALKFDIISPADPDSGSCMIAARIPVPGSKIDTMKARHLFRDRHKIEVAFPSLDDGTSLIRVSAAWFASENQFDYLATVLKKFEWEPLIKS
jgi:selenocysteine lyase/cysteine desulfurase